MTRYCPSVSQKRLRRAQGNRCYLCSQPFDWPAPPGTPSRRHWNQMNQITRDHVWPRAHGGTLSPGNKLLAHMRCNVAKGARAPHPCEILYLEGILAILGLR